MRRILILLGALGLAGCAALGSSDGPIATETIAAPQPGGARALVIVLPGYGDRGTGAKEHGMARAIHEAWPQADVLLAAATWPYYRDRNLPTRLHEDVIAPALRAGYKRIWIAGASMGGLGALLYERERPGVLAGVALFAPYLGDEPLLEEIRKAGGIRSWDPGPLPAEVDGKNFQRHLWKMVRDWTERPASAPRVWLAVGSKDYLVGGSRLLATALPAERFVETPGDHDWKTWSRIGRTVFANIRTLEPDSL